MDRGPNPCSPSRGEGGDRVSNHRAERPRRVTLPGVGSGRGLGASAIATGAQVLAGTLDSPSDLGDPAGQRGGRREPGNASHPRLCKTAPSLLRESHVTGGAIGLVNYINGLTLYMGIEHSKFSKSSDMCKNEDI